MEQKEKKNVIGDLLKELGEDESFLDSPEAREKFIFDLTLIMIEI
jgi:hypothetical protein